MLVKIGALLRNSRVAWSAKASDGVARVQNILVPPERIDLSTDWRERSPSIGLLPITAMLGFYNAAYHSCNETP